MKEKINKFERGDPLSDEECQELRDFFLLMEQGCSCLGCEYNLFADRMRRNRYTVEGYIEARKY